MAMTNTPPDLNTSVTDCTKNGICSNCGDCCPDILHISDNEIATIKNYIKTHNIQPVLHGDITSDNYNADWQCPFLDTNKPTEKCNIYAVRPTICQVFSCNKQKMQNQTLTEKQKEELHNATRMQTTAGEKKKPSVNMHQTFYPNVFLPKINDFVIINKQNPTYYERYKNNIYVVITNTYIMDGMILIQDIHNPNIGLKIPIGNVTKLYKTDITKP